MYSITTNVVKLTAICLSLSCFLTGCLTLDAPPCPETSPADVIYVHGNKGSDSEGTGECSVPFKTITKAITVANASNARTIHIFGDSTPIVYGTATNGERFPLRLEKAALRLEGEGDTKVILRGGGACEPIDATLNCAIAAIGTGVEIRGMQIENIAGYGIRADAPLVTIEDVHVTNSGATGIFLRSDKANLTRTRVTNSANEGVRTVSPTGVNYEVSILGCTFSSNNHRGLYAEGAGAITSTGSTYADNKWDGIGCHQNVRIDSKDDTFERNDDGLSALGDVTGTVELDVQNAKVNSNRNNGVHVMEAKSVRIRNSTMLGNVAAGFRATIAGAGIDLGSPNDPGGNTFQSATTPNGSGICFEGTGTLTAQANHFKNCPPTSRPDFQCLDSVDIGGSGQILFDGCLAP